MPLISRYTKGPLYPLYRTTGIYGHLPRNGYKGYVVLITKKLTIQFFYGLRNPYRPGKVVEWWPTRVPDAYMVKQGDGTVLYLRGEKRIARHH